MHGRGPAFRRCGDVGGKAEEGTVQLCGDPTAVRRWKRRLWEQLQLPVCFVDTELTNKQTKTHPKKKKKTQETNEQQQQQKQQTKQATNKTPSLLCLFVFVE